MIGTQDPYCKVSIKGANAYKQFTTRVINNGDKGSKGTAATWNQKFSFVKMHEKTVRERILRIAVKNMNNVDSTLIGQVEIPLNTFLDGRLVGGLSMGRQQVLCAGTTAGRQPSPLQGHPAPLQLVARAARCASVQP